MLWSLSNPRHRYVRCPLHGHHTGSCREDKAKEGHDDGASPCHRFNPVHVHDSGELICSQKGDLSYYLLNGLSIGQ